MREPRIRVSRLRMMVLAAMAIVTPILFVAYPRWHQGHMLGIVREWGRLAPIPDDAKGLRVATEGSMFTRAFRASFSAPSREIERWLSESPGTREAKTERRSPTIRCYLIRPGGGAQHAEVSVDDASGMVNIYVYWS